MTKKLIHVKLNYDNLPKTERTKLYDKTYADFQAAYPEKDGYHVYVSDKDTHVNIMEVRD